MLGAMLFLCVGVASLPLIDITTRGNAERAPQRTAENAAFEAAPLGRKEVAAVQLQALLQQKVEESERVGSATAQMAIERAHVSMLTYQRAGTQGGLGALAEWQMRVDALQEDQLKRDYVQHKRSDAEQNRYSRSDSQSPLLTSSISIDAFF